MSSAFSIKTETFEGPMELLIELVEKRKLLINDISLAAVTDEYMQTVSSMQELSLPNTSQFITLAATLLLIKSKSLLPILDLTSEEEASIDDLEERLKRYQLYRDASLDLQSRFGKQVMYEREFTRRANLCLSLMNFVPPQNWVKPCTGFWLVCLKFLPSLKLDLIQPSRSKP